jgi:hypothetical protein
MLVYSVNPREGYVTKPAIEKMRSSLVREIFQQDLLQIYTEQTSQRNMLAEKSCEALKEIIGKMNGGIYESETIESLLSHLAERLKHTSGKKQYGYLKAPLKTIVDQIVDELAKDVRVAEAYAKWQELQSEVLCTYMDKLPDPVLISQQKEFKHIKNMVITEAVNIGSHHFTFEGDDAAEDLHEASDVTLPEDEYQTIMDDAPEGGTEKDVEAAIGYTEKAVLWLTRAADNGSNMAQYVLGKLYCNGEYVEKDIAKAVELFTKAAEQNNSFAQYHCGKLYLLGEDIPKDVEAALRWLTMSAEQNNQYAQYTLGKLYLMGRDVPRDREAAMRWFTLSAEQGNIYAQFFLNHPDVYRDPSLILAATRLLHHLSRIFRHEQKRLSGGPGIQVESKLRRRIREKKIAQGHAPDDYELRQTTC